VATSPQPSKALNARAVGRVNRRAVKGLSFMSAILKVERGMRGQTRYLCLLFRHLLR
jgi:hypothetical protein